MNKSIYTLLLIIFTISLFGSTSAQDFDFDTPTVQYGDSVELTVDCQPESECQASGDPTAAALYIDGYNVATEASSGGAFSTPLLEWPITFEFDIPEGMNDAHYAPLTPGDHIMQVQIEGSSSDGPSGTSSPFTVEAKNMEDHIGENMILNKRIDHVGQDTPELRNFQITNDVWDYNTGIATDDSVVIMVQNYDAGGGDPLGGTNLFGVYEVQPTDNPNDNVLSFDDSSIWEWVERVQYTEERNDEVQIYDARSVLEEDFTSGNLFEYGDVEGSSSWQISSQSPLHDSGNFLLDGEVALGYYPYHYDEEGDLVNPEEGRRDSPDLYVCREGAEMDNGFGDSVSQIVDVTEDEDDFNPLRCNQNTGTWEDVGECAVSIDTYGYGYLNNEINGCEENGGDCEAGEAIMEGGMVYACYNDDDGDLVKEPYDEWTDNGNDVIVSQSHNSRWGEQLTIPQEFGGGTTNIFDIDNYGPSSDYPERYLCDHSAGPGNCRSSQESGIPDDRPDWQNYGSMWYVEYAPYPDYLEWEATVREGTDPWEGWNSDFVTDTGGWTVQVQSLVEAEEMYAQGDAMFGESYEPLNMSNIGIDTSSLKTRYYNQTTAINHRPAWRIANAGTGSEYVDDFSYNFPGGWAGRCEDELEWTYDDDPEPGEPSWSCDGEIVDEEGFSTSGDDEDVVIDPAMETTAYLPGTDTENGEREIGVVLFPFVNMDQSERFDAFTSDLTEQLVDPHYDSASDKGDVVGVLAKCWAGSMSDKPTDATGDFDHNSDRAFEAQVSKPSNNIPWSVSDTVDTSGYSGYACRWAYEVSDASEFVRGSEGDVAHVHRDQDLEEELRNNFGQNDFPEDSFP